MLRWGLEPRGVGYCLCKVHHHRLLRAQALVCVSCVRLCVSCVFVCRRSLCVWGPREEKKVRLRIFVNSFVFIVQEKTSLTFDLWSLQGSGLTRKQLAGPLGLGPTVWIIFILFLKKHCFKPALINTLVNCFDIKGSTSSYLLLYSDNQLPNLSVVWLECACVWCVCARARVCVCVCVCVFFAE